MPEDPRKRFSTGFAARWKESSAHLFVGPPGSGKGEAVRSVAETFLGRSENHPDLVWITPEKGTIKIETIRKLTERLSLKPFSADRVIVVIEEADTMTEAAANALLKTLEEPPPFALFILIAEADENLPSTIRSRCQKVLFRIEKEDLRRIFALNYSSWQKEIDPLFAQPSKQFPHASRLAEQIAAERDRLPSLFELLRGLWHDVAVWRESGGEGSLLLPSASERTRSLAQNRDSRRIFRDLETIEETERAIEGNVHKMLALERMFVKLMAP